MEIKGKVKQILPATTGTSARGEWSKQTVIIETAGEYPKDIALLFFNKPELIDRISIGCTATFGINIQSREYNQKWYTDITVYGASDIQGYVSSAPSPAPQVQPTQAQQVSPQPSYAQNNNSMVGDDGMPF